MNTTLPNSQEKLLTLQEAAQKLGVSVEILLSWNDYQILKPTIMTDGRVGYFPQQIDQFIRIQQSFLSTHSSALPVSSLVQRPDEPVAVPQTSFQPAQAVHKSHPLRFFSLLVVALLVIMAAAITQQEQLKQLLTHYETSYNTQSSSQGSQTSNLQLNGPVSYALPQQQKSDGSLTKNSREDSGSAFAQNTANDVTISKTATPTPSSTQQNRSLIATVAGVMKSLVEKKTSTSLPSTNTINQTSTFASLITRPTGTSVPNSPFDKSGNIAGTPKSDALAMNFGNVNVGSISNSDVVTNNIRNQLIVIIIGALGTLVYFLRKPHKSAVVTTAGQIVPAVDTSEKILEVDQKMDGTVVLLYQGNEHKISKPELDSDSDQFISHLMKLVPPGMKEIEYDSFTDGKSNAGAPLSRLVTRLGFVGTKRDLFFPRTSKNRVLFRKYITREDLRIMRITPEQIIRDLSLV